MNITKIDATLEDGTVVTVFPVAVAPAPTIKEVDVVESDGTIVKTEPVATPAA